MALSFPSKRPITAKNATPQPRSFQYHKAGSCELAPEVGFEPTTNRLTADRSTTELLRNCTAAGVVCTASADRDATFFAINVRAKAERRDGIGRRISGTHWEYNSPKQPDPSAAKHQHRTSRTIPQRILFHNSLQSHRISLKCVPLTDNQVPVFENTDVVCVFEYVFIAK